ncbi:hypothetical protein GOP47_0019445 [Adiantum capillus-veneris]|uniref:Peptidase C14 caspase domain-containing protein n=1 Tax=Adiantum capillus-veneris TaxID=13818 RepID=A0A9D4Z8H0_ADICA|nr:hypothetical protein GOP47_0019445 [Adiantum capillus-veneris]
MAKKAVLVGCNYPNTKAELHGCINDPTGANIKRALNKLVAESQPGDILFFHYSGHGVRLPAETGEDDDTGYDECIVPCDMNLITDDDFREIVDKVPQGATLTLISDSCHSGGLVNNAKEQIGESSQPGGEQAQAKREGSGFREGLRGFLSDKIHGALEDRGIDIRGLGHSHSRHHRFREQDEYFQQVSYEGDGFAKSRALPLSTLIDILKQKTGKDDLDVGNIRPTLFDMFGEDSSSKVKKFVKVLFQSMHHDDDDEGNGSGHHHHGFVSALAQQFMKHKLDEVEDTDAYLKPALETPVSDEGQAYAGAGGPSRAFRDMGILVSGCQSSETSADANPSGNANEGYGAMSNAVQVVLSEHDGPITNHEIVTRVRKILKKQGFSQRPGLYCTDHNAHALFIC